MGAEKEASRFGRNPIKKKYKQTISITVNVEEESAQEKFSIEIKNLKI